jgi:hypothetical protein
MLLIAIAAQVLTCGIALALLWKDWAQLRRQASYLPLATTLSTVLLAGLSILLVVNADRRDGENKIETAELRTNLRTGLDQSRLLQQEVADLREAFRLAREDRADYLTVHKKATHVRKEVTETAADQSGSSTSNIPPRSRNDDETTDPKATEFGPLPRYLLAQMKDEFIQCLRKKPGRVSLVSEANDDEAYKYAQDWLSVFQSAGWEIEHKENPIQLVARDEWGGTVLKLNFGAATNSPAANVRSCFYPTHRLKLPEGVNIWPEPNFPPDYIRIIIRHATKK